MIKCSIIIPTRNQTVLKDCLDALSSQQGILNIEYEVIVVENPKATDSTRRLVQSYQNDNFIYTTSSGSANEARNAGIDASKGEILCFTDDDCIPNPHWVSRHLAMHTLYVDVGCVGGPMYLTFKSDIPGWLCREFRATLGECELTTPSENSMSFEVFPFDTENHGWISSGNLSISRNMISEIGHFPGSLSIVFRNDQSVAANDEVVFTQRCSEAGFPGMVYAPTVWLDHQVSQSKTTLAYMKRRFFVQGFADGTLPRNMSPALNTANLYYETVQHHDSLSIDFPYSEEVKSEVGDDDLQIYITNLAICKTCYLMGFQEGIHGHRVFDFHE